MENIERAIELKQNLLLQQCQAKCPHVNAQKIIKTVRFIREAHHGSLRKSGITVTEYCLEVASLLLEYMYADENTILAALLHNIYDAGKEYDYKVIKSEFGATVADIVDSVFKIQRIERHNIDVSDKLDNYRRLLIGLFSDIRILFVKIAERLQGMQSIEYLSDAAQIRFAKETLYIYTPFINRMGLQDIKSQFEDLSFKILNPTAYNDIFTKLNASKEERDQYVKDIIAPINEKLTQDAIVKFSGMKWKVYGRAKHIYSIYNKMLARKKPFEELYDIFALRLVLDTDNPTLCYYVYGLVASLFPAAEETFKDYISAPKKNGYQSIHTGVVAKDNKVIEVQVRTDEMHFACENGVAAHFRYKNNAVTSESVFENDEVTTWLTNIRDIFENIDNLSFDEVLDSVNRNLFMDDIYLFTPKNDYISLPRGSVPLDYAFKIHTDIGKKYIGAKVNSKIVPVDYKLQTGDRCEIITSNNAHLEKEWLHYVVTPKAKSMISKIIKEERKKAIRRGHDIWQEDIKPHALDIKNQQLRLIARAFNYASLDHFFIAIARNEIDVSKVIEYAYYRMSNYAFPSKGRGKVGAKKVDGTDILTPNKLYSFKVQVSQKQPVLNEILLLIIKSRFVNIRKLEIVNDASIMTFNFSVHLPSEEKFDELLKMIQEVTHVKSIKKI